MYVDSCSVSRLSSLLTLLLAICAAALPTPEAKVGTRAQSGLALINLVEPWATEKSVVGVGKPKDDYIIDRTM